MSANRDAANRIRKNLEKLERGDRVPLPIAQLLIKESAWWYGHPQGAVRAPKHYERVTDGKYGWEIEFGANSFLVEQAILGCKKVILKHLDKAIAEDSPIDLENLRNELTKSIRRAVAHETSGQYDKCWPLQGDHMVFGTQSMHPGDFVNKLLRIIELNST